MITLIYTTKSELIISKKEYSNWKQVKKDYENYVSSNTFMDQDRFINYLVDEYVLEEEIVNRIKSFFKDNEIIEIRITI